MPSSETQSAAFESAGRQPRNGEAPPDHGFSAEAAAERGRHGAGRERQHGPDFSAWSSAPHGFSPNSGFDGRAGFGYAPFGASPFGMPPFWMPPFGAPFAASPFGMFPFAPSAGAEGGHPPWPPHGAHQPNPSEPFSMWTRFMSWWVPFLSWWSSSLMSWWPRTSSPLRNDQPAADPMLRLAMAQAEFWHHAFHTLALMAQQARKAYEPFADHAPGFSGPGNSGGAAAPGGAAEAPDGSVDMHKLRESLKSMDPIQAGQVLHAVQTMQAMDMMRRKRSSPQNGAARQEW